MLKLPSPNELIMQGVDLLYSLSPQPLPSMSQLESARIVAHRGAHTGDLIRENTLEAFDLALKKQLWGIEFDVRWTKDEVPVVLHDPTLERVFPELNHRLSDLNFSELRQHTILVPKLEDIIQNFSQKLHLMIEIKESLNTENKRKIMSQLLSHLKPEDDFHILSLTPEIFDDFNFLPPHCYLPVAEWNIKELSELALKNQWAGITGHYLLLSEGVLTRHHLRGQKVGTGFANSKNLLFRELNRATDWVFTDDALRLKGILDKALKS